jgi:hypothetical protein
VSDWIAVGLVTFAVAVAVATATTERSIRRAPQALIRSNFRGMQLPAVLGTPLGAGTVAGSLVAWVFALTSDEGVLASGPAIAVALIIGLLGIAGTWDDFRGDERPRGFAGHLGAARTGVITGGIVKAGAGAIAGLLSGALVTDGWAIVTTGAVVALGANLFNLLDRAPGRTLKAGVVAGVALLFAGATSWFAPGAGVVGASAAVLWPDLRERAMLGDAGANPLGGALGLGLAMSLSFTGQIVSAVVLLALNLASERWSFSAVIDALPVLRALDRLGRRT